MQTPRIQSRLGVAVTCILMLLIVALPQPSTAQIAEPEESEVPRVNVLSIDLGTGDVLDYEDNGHSQTDVHIVGVAESIAGFHLVDPAESLVFANQSSTSAGIVEFWGQQLLPGQYSVLGYDESGEVDVLTTFDATEYASPSPSAYQLPCGIELNLDQFTSQAAAAELCELPPVPPIPPIRDPCDRVDCSPNIEVCDGGGFACLLDDLPECNLAFASFGAQAAAAECPPEVCPDGSLRCITDRIPSAPCGTAGKPSCVDYICKGGLCDIDLPCGDANSPPCDCDSLLTLPDGCDPNLPCNDTGKPSCVDYACGLIPGPGCVPPLPTVTVCPTGTYGAKVDGTGICYTPPTPPCGGKDQPSCQDHICSTMDPPCDPCDTSGPNDCLGNTCQIAFGDRGCDPDLPCNDTGKPSCVDYVCLFVPGPGCVPPIPTVTVCPTGQVGAKVDGTGICYPSPCPNINDCLDYLPCGTADTPSCVDYACYAADDRNACDPNVPPAPDADPPNPGDPPSPSPGDCPAGPNGTTRKIDEGTYWTPLVINHAPFRGTSTATANWQSAAALYVFPVGYESSKSSSVRVDITTGGKTAGEFQLAKWGMYEVTKGNYCNGHYIVRTAKVIDWAPQGFVNSRPFDLMGGSYQTDADDATSVSASGYGSVTFQTRYVTKDRQQSTTSTQGSVHGVSSTIYAKIGGSLSFSKGAVSMEVLEFSASKSSGNSYEYTFPKGPHCWDIDELGGGGSGGWAFKYRGAFICP